MSLPSVNEKPATHTPPPWRQRVLLVQDANGQEIAHCTRWERGTPMPEVAEANARLIVSAVNSQAELLQLVREARELLSLDENGLSLSDWIKAADAAIQKATS